MFPSRSIAKQISLAGFFLLPVERRLSSQVEVWTTLTATMGLMPGKVVNLAGPILIFGFCQSAPASHFPEANRTAGIAWAANSTLPPGITFSVSEEPDRGRKLRAGGKPQFPVCPTLPWHPSGGANLKRWLPS